MSLQTELLFLFGVACGMLAATIASGKHRNPFGWLAIGVLFPVLGVILAIVLPPNPVGSPELTVE